MKTWNILPFLLLALAGCSHKSPEAHLDYPYSTASSGDYWYMWDQKNALVALHFLKAFENGRIDEAMSAIGDSVRWTYDYFDRRICKDSLKARLQKFRSDTRLVQVRMNDWKSFINLSSRKQHVILLYRLVWEANNGRKDSVEKIDDIELDKGKIISLEEKSRHLPKNT